jgi:hypothetical protein
MPDDLVVGRVYRNIYLTVERDVDVGVRLKVVELVADIVGEEVERGLRRRDG